MSGAGVSRGLIHALFSPMKFLIFIGVNVGGAIGWSLGEPFGFMTAFFVSGLGSCAGVYAGWWVARRYIG
jgi:hypothetical protein